MDEIDYDAIRAHIDQMINLLEYDSSRSPGKMKLNSQHLHSLIWLREHYTPRVKPGPKPKKQEE